MFNITELENKAHIELIELAKQMGINRASHLEQKELIYRILDHQASHPEKSDASAPKSKRQHMKPQLLAESTVTADRPRPRTVPARTKLPPKSKTASSLCPKCLKCLRCPMCSRPTAASCCVAKRPRNNKKKSKIRKVKESKSRKVKKPKSRKFKKSKSPQPLSHPATQPPSHPAFQPPRLPNLSLPNASVAVPRRTSSLPTSSPIPIRKPEVGNRSRRKVKKTKNRKVKKTEKPQPPSHPVT